MNSKNKNFNYRLSSHKYTLVLDLDETLIHFFYVSTIYLYTIRLIMEGCSLLGLIYLSF